MVFARPKSFYATHARSARRLVRCCRVAVLVLIASLFQGIGFCQSGGAVRVKFQATTPDGNAMISGVEVTFGSGRDRSRTFTAITNQEGLVNLPADEDPFTNPVDVRIVAFPRPQDRTVRLKWEGKASQLLRVTKAFEIRFTAQQITKLRDNVVSIPFAKIVVTPLVEKKMVPATLKIGMGGENAISFIFIVFDSSEYRDNSPAILYCPNGSDTQALHVEGRLTRTVVVTGLYLDGANDYRGSCRFALPVPGGERRLTLELRLQSQQFDAWKERVIEIMTGIAGQNTAQRLNDVQGFFQDRRPDNGNAMNGGLYYPPNIYFPLDFDATKSDAPENMFHEWSHAIMDRCYQANEPGVGHEPDERVTPAIAWSEGRAHFVSACFCRALGGNPGNLSPQEALAREYVLLPEECMGSRHELIVCTALLTFYERRGLQGGAEILTDFYTGYSGIRNCRDFFNAVRTANAGDTNIVDIACQVEILFRITPPNRSLFRAQIIEGQEKKAGQPLRLQGRVITANGRPLIPEFRLPVRVNASFSTDRITYAWSEKGRELGKGERLAYMPPDNNVHEIRLQAYLQAPMGANVLIGDVTRNVQAAQGGPRDAYTMDWWLFKPVNWNSSQELRFTIQGPLFTVARENMDGSTRNLNIEIPSQPAGQELKYTLKGDMRNRRVDESLAANAKLHQLWQWKITDSKGTRYDRRPNPECSIVAGERTEVVFFLTRPKQMVDGQIIQPPSTYPTLPAIKITFIPKTK